MADRDLIQHYLADLARRLPPEAVEELADGLEETVEHHVRRGLTPAAAAAVAVEEFGRPAEVTAAFARQSAGRRTALALLVTSPVFAALWGTTLIGSQAWTWQIPLGVEVLFGAALLAVAATLAVVARSNNPSTTRLAAPSSVVLLLLDLGMLTAVATATPTLTWVMALAIPASLTRVVLTARNLPRVLAR
jgi:hypothetical protein